MDPVSVKNACFKVWGYFYSQLGQLKVVARFNKWSKLNNSEGKYTHNWGAVADSGQVIILKSDLEKIMDRFIFKNSYENSRS